MKYFVTGATGFVGRHIVSQLVEAGHQVVALVREPEKAQQLEKLGVVIAQGDITNKNSMREPMRSTDGVFHLAAWYKLGVKNMGAAEQVNVQGTRNVLELMKELGIRKGVYTSTLSINSDTHGQEVDETYRFTGQQLSVYDRTKWMAHYEVANPMIASGLPLIIVMPGVTYGPGDTSSLHLTLVQYLQRKLPIVPKRTTFTWAYVEDIARAHILAMDKGKVGETYIIAGPTHQVTEVLDIAEAITGIPAPHRTASPAMMKTMSAIMRVVEKVIPVPQTYSSEVLRINAGVTLIGSNAKAKRDLGYDPRSLQEGLIPTLHYEMQLLGIKPF
jgi:nucleoside-diphosphate-sugar epimerase